MLTLRIRNRDDSLPTRLLPIRWTVEKLEWLAQGGPDLLDVRGDTASEPDAGDALDLLRCPVEVWDDALMRPLWWGYVNAVEVQIGVVVVGLSLDAMANTVSVVYNDGAARYTTALALNDTSIATYGAKERRETLSDGTETLANALRDAMLAQRAAPVPTIEIADEPAERPRITLRARGWWHTLTWRYYANVDPSSIETTTQLATMIGSVAPLLGVVQIVTPSGITMSAERDGDSTAAQIADDLLNAGSTTALRLLARVQSDRRVVVVSEPLRTDLPLQLRRDGTVADAYNIPLSRATPPVGRWIELIDVLPPRVLRGGADPLWHFIERASYDVARGRWRIEPRGVADVWDLAGVG